MTIDLNVEYNLFKKRDYYYVDFWIDGVRYKKSTRKKRRIEAEIMAKEIIGATLEELYGHTELTLSHLVSRYGNVIKIENKTWKTKMAMLMLFMEFTGDIRLSKISPSLCQEFIIELPGRKIKQATVNRYIATLKHFFNKAIDWELMERNPMSRIKKFRETPRMRFFSSGELDRLITSAHQMLQENISHNQNMFYYIMMTAIYTGMRLGEIIHLKWMDIRDGNFLIKKTKSGLSRIVPIKKELMDVLRELPTTDEYVFPLNRRSSDVITKIWHKARERAGIKEGRFHDLRHTFGSNLIKSGVDVVTVKELLGHSDLKMTQIYTHSSLGQKQRAISDLDI